MKEIEFQNYNIILPNTVWGKDAGIITVNEGVEVPVLEMIIAVKYTAPTKKQAIQLIQKVAKEYKPCSTQDYGEEKAEIPLSEFAQMLPKEFLEQIAKGENNSLNRWIEQYPKDDHEEGRTYIQLSVGTTAAENIPALKNMAKEHGEKEYEEVQQNASTKKWYLRIRLNSKSKFPELYYLLQSGVRESDVMTARGNYENYSNVIKHVDLLHNALYDDRQSKINMLKDKTRDLLQARAAQTMQNTARRILEQQTSKFIFV